MDTLEIQVTQKRVKGKEVFEGTVKLHGITPAKIIRQTDGGTYFESRSALTTSARSLARQFGDDTSIVLVNSPRSSHSRTTSSRTRNNVRSRSVTARYPVRQTVS